MDLLIQDAEPCHLEQMEEIEKLCFSVPWTRDQLRAQLKDAQHACIVACDPAERVLGYVGMTIVLDEGYIGNVAVRPECRRQGIADRLIERLTALGRLRALSFLTLEVRTGNAAAIALYRKHGFEKCGLRKNYYSLPREDAVIMTKFL